MKEDATRSIVQIKTGIAVRNWKEQIRVCQESGKTVKVWSGENGISVGTYYSRLRRICIYRSDYTICTVFLLHPCR